MMMSDVEQCQEMRKAKIDLWMDLEKTVVESFAYKVYERPGEVSQANLWRVIMRELERR